MKGIQKLNNSRYHGNIIRVEEAKENFLDRLKREQEERRKKTEAEIKITPDLRTVVTDSSERDEQRATRSIEKNKRKRNNSENQEFQWKIKPFNGTCAVTTVKIEATQLVSSNQGPESHAADLVKEVSKKKRCEDENKKDVLQNEKIVCENEKFQEENSDILKSLEKFSSVWADANPDNEVKVKKPKKKEKKVDEQKKHVDKYSKKKSDNEKRLKSLEERSRAFLSQKNLVKAALSLVDAAKPTKIIFDDEGEEEGDGEETVGTDTSNLNIDKARLFDEEDDASDFEADFTEKPQFEGKKGKELFDLQSRYSKDERFDLDQRFLKQAMENPTEVPEDLEKDRQLKILSEITGKEVTVDKRKNDNFVKTSMLARYDPTKTENSIEKNKKMKSDEGASYRDETLATTSTQNSEVSQERFFETTDNLSGLFAKKDSFSLLQNFGTETTVENEIVEVALDQDESPEKKEQTTTEGKVLIPPKNLWIEPFFFKRKDERLLEGQDFFFGRVDDPEEYRLKWQTKRQDLVKIYRSHHRRSSMIRAFKKKYTLRKRY
ncbi:hypothetical protein QYM36_001574 [Artemia franciscana]|uniref:Nucleolar protein 8 n=1 Tax=Artemia franciscana TaxID=6661 RepID=A0AA88IDF4_ARTSF|nr:hypothetical protein QYM36_001574 [Artemia franciscana]